MTATTINTTTPGVSLGAKDLLQITDLTGDELRGLLDLALTIKHDPGDWTTALAGQSVALIFEKPSLRTRASLEVGLHRLGAQAVYFDQQGSPIGHRESAADYGRNLERWFHGIVARVHHHDVLDQLGNACAVPIVNALSDLHHPCQALADMLTLREHGVDPTGMTLAYVGDGNNVCHSLIEAVCLLGGTMVVIGPTGNAPDADIVAAAARHGGAIHVTDDLDALSGADAVYTDTWISMGQSADAGKRHAMEPYRIDVHAMAIAGPRALFMHCLPAHRGEEVVDDVIDGPNSVVFDQAENRMHAQNAWFVAALQSTS